MTEKKWKIFERFFSLNLTKYFTVYNKQFYILDYDISVKGVADLVKIIQYIEQQVEHQVLGSTGFNLFFV